MKCVESERESHVMVPTVYISFLVRLWRDPEPQPPERPTAWQGEIEHIQSGRRSTFNSLDDLLGFLRQQVAGMENGGRGATEAGGSARLGASRCPGGL